jgi:feruloyl esterase
MKLVVHAVSALAVALVAQNGSQFRDWQDAALAGATRYAPMQACADIVSRTGYDFSIVSATHVPAAGTTPDHCHVIGLIQPEIRFEVNLPSAWNGRLYMFGNGGYAGEALDNPGRQATAARALARGFATAQSNTGHDAAVEPLAAFASSPQKVIDYAFRAVHVTALTAKTLLQDYYAAGPVHAYFDGCSTGGRQGLISAQRFPDDFDGIVVGAPVLNFSGTMIGYAKDQKALAAAPLTAEAIKTVGDAVVAACDAADGVKDGVIDDPRRCRFTPSRDIATCSGDAAPGCLTQAQLRTVETIYAPVIRNGAVFFPGWPPGAEPGWIPWFVAPNGRSISGGFGEAFLKNIAFGHPNASYDWLTFDVNTDLDKIQPARALIDATTPDLSRFKARGGKIVSYVGWADPALNPLMTVGYYEDVMKRMGAATSDFYRMFMVPGMAHCGGGSGTSTFDAFTPLVRWVEHGTAPDTIPAARVVNGQTVRTRPLCPYPQTAIYKGSGSTDDAASFSCGVR